MTWILVPQPPRERPKAWSFGSSAGPLFCEHLPQPYVRELNFHQYTTIPNQSFPQHLTATATSSESDRKYQSFASQQIDDKSFAKDRTMEANPAREHPYKESKKVRLRFAGGPEEVDLGFHFLSSGKDFRFSPTEHPVKRVSWYPSLLGLPPHKKGIDQCSEKNNHFSDRP